MINKIKEYRVIKSQSGQAGAEMILLVGGMLIIVLVAIYYYKDYLKEIGDELNNVELNQLNNTFTNISNKFK